MSRRQAVTASILLALIAAALIGFGTATVVDSLSGQPAQHGGGLHR
ncbi:hypothetical protein [Leifsonia sp. NPDC080035]|uniref:Uncharacterized protein n=1 Tax=Leifsonia sp. NPDC080035 TaxID=3143936 RepID=A0AAU7GC12_9MICO